ARARQIPHAIQRGFEDTRSITAAEKNADIGRSVTAVWLYASHPADVASMAAPYHAVSCPHSDFSLAQKKTRKARLSAATGSRGARSGPSPERKAVAVIQ